MGDGVSLCRVNDAFSCLSFLCLGFTILKFLENLPLAFWNKFLWLSLLLGFFHFIDVLIFIGCCHLTNLIGFDLY